MLRVESRAEQLPLPKTIYGYVWQISRNSQVWLCVGSVASFLLALAPLELQRRIVNEALKDRDLRALVYLGAAYVVAALTMGLIKWWLNVYRGIVSERAVWALRMKVQAAVKHDYESGLKSKEGTTIAVALAEVEPVGGFVGMALSEPLLQGGIMVFTFAYLVWVQPWMALLCFVVFSPQLVFVPYMQAAINRRAATRIKILRKVGSQLVDGYEEPKSFRGGRLYTREVTTVLGLNIRIFRLKFSMHFYMNSLHHLGIIGILLVGGWFVIEGRTGPGTILAFISGLRQLKDPWADLVNYYREATIAQVKYKLVSSALGMPDASVALNENVKAPKAR